jgi:hypothetical protein
MGVRLEVEVKFIKVFPERVMVITVLSVYGELKVATAWVCVVVLVAGPNEVVRVLVIPSDGTSARVAVRVSALLLLVSLDKPEELDEPETLVLNKRSGGAVGPVEKSI